MLFGSKDKTVVSAEAATTPLSEENTAEAMARSDEIHELQAEKTQLMGRADYYKCLSQQFEHQLQHAVQLYQQSQTQLIQLEQNVSIRNEEVDKTIRVSPFHNIQLVYIRIKIYGTVHVSQYIRILL